MASNEPITDELLSAYLDNAVTEQERALIDEATARDPDVAWRLTSLRYTVDLLHNLPDIAPPRTFTLADLQAAGMLDDRFSIPMTSSASSVGWLDRLRAMLSAGNPVWRNAAAACTALLVVVFIGQQMRLLPETATTDIAPAPTLSNAARTNTPLEPEPSSRDASARGSQTTLPTHAASVAESTADTAGTSSFAGADDGDSGDDVNAITVAAPPTAAQAKISAPQETTAGDFHADEAPAETANEDMAVIAAVQASAAMVDEGVADEMAAYSARTVPDSAPETDGERSGMMQSMSLASPGSTDDLQELMVPPAAAADIAPAAATSLQITTADAAISVPALAPMSGYVVPDTIDDQQSSAEEAVEPSGVPRSTELPADDRRPNDARDLPATGNPADVGDAGESVSPARIADTPDQTIRTLDMIAILQLALALAALLFTFFWLLSTRRSPLPPSTSIDQRHHS